MRSPRSVLLLPAALLAAAGLTWQCDGGVAAECEIADDCLPSELCVDNLCEPNEGWTCSTAQPCPEGQHCCNSTCGTQRCCTVHTDCPDGYCQDNRCQDGVIPGCPEVDCDVGVCDTRAGFCVECTRDSDCEDPQICGTAQTCVDEDQDCDSTSCGQPTPFCAPEAGCRACLERTGDCGDQVCDAGVCVRCDLTSEPCPGGLTCNADGFCVLPTGIWCGEDDDCGERVCTQVAASYWNECMSCGLPGECGTNRDCNVGEGVCEALTPVCADDSDCSPPITVCNAGLCVPGCSRQSCYQGQACNLATGRCFPIHPGAPDLDLFGETCTGHGECLSGACWYGDFNWAQGAICTWPCVKQGDCPAGSVCWELGDSTACIWIDLAFNAPLPSLDLPSGASCDRGSTIQSLDCRSGYCEPITAAPGDPVCLEMCARDADCENLSVDDLVCVSGWPIGEDFDDSGVLDEDEIVGFSQLCHQGWGHLGPNQPCGTGSEGIPVPSDHDDCRSGWCTQTPDRREVAHCAQPCCTPGDCGPDNPICKPIDVWDGWRELNETSPYGFQKICLWAEYEGTLDVGEICTSDVQCKSEICAAATFGGTKRCTHTCCTNDDCAGYGWAPVCRKPYPDTTTLYDTNFTALRYSLGRRFWAQAGGAYSEAIGMSGLCMP